MKKQKFILPKTKDELRALIIAEYSNQKIHDKSSICYAIHAIDHNYSYGFNPESHLRYELLSRLIIMLNTDKGLDVVGAFMPYRYMLAEINNPTTSENLAEFSRLALKNNLEVTQSRNGYIIELKDAEFRLSGNKFTAYSTQPMNSASSEIISSYIDNLNSLNSAHHLVK